MSKPAKTITAEEFDRKFEAGEDLTEHLDLANAVKRVNVDFPLWMLKELDAEAARLQVPRQAVIKMLIADQLEARKTRGRRIKVLHEAVRDVFVRGTGDVVYELKPVEVSKAFNWYQQFKGEDEEEVRP